MKPGGRSRRPAPPPSTVPFTVAEKVSTTTAGSELCGQARAGQRAAAGRAGRGGGGAPGEHAPGTRQGAGSRGYKGQTDSGDRVGLRPCRLTEAASLAAVSPGSWAPAAGWVPPATSDASVGCNINASEGSDAGGRCDSTGTGAVGGGTPTAGRGTGLAGLRGSGRLDRGAGRPRNAKLPSTGPWDATPSLPSAGFSKPRLLPSWWAPRRLARPAAHAWALLNTAQGRRGEGGLGLGLSPGHCLLP